MAILLYLDTLGILLSFVVDLSLLVGVSLPFGKMAIVFSVGLLVVFLARLRVTKELRQGNEWFFTANMKNLCPRWLKVLMSVILVYGILILVVSLRVVYLAVVNADFSTTMADLTTASRNLHIGGFALIMMCYAIECSVLYLYKSLKKEADHPTRQGSD